MFGTIRTENITRSVYLYEKKKKKFFSRYFDDTFGWKEFFSAHELVFRNAYSHLFGDQGPLERDDFRPSETLADNRPYISFLNNKKMLMQRRARYRLGPVYEIINNRVSPVAIIFTSTLLRRYTVSPGYALSLSLRRPVSLYTLPT